MNSFFNIFGISLLFLNVPVAAMKRVSIHTNKSEAKKLKTHEKESCNYTGPLVSHPLFKVKIPELFACCIDEKSVELPDQEQQKTMDQAEIDEIKKQIHEKDKNVARALTLLNNGNGLIFSARMKDSNIDMTILHALAMNKDAGKKEILDLLQARLEKRFEALEYMAGYFDQDGNLPLHIAVSTLNFQMAEFLIKYNSPLNMDNNSNQTVFCGRHHEEKWKCQFDPNYLFNGRADAQITANQIKMIEILVNAGINLDKVRKNSVVMRTCTFCQSFCNFLQNLKSIQTRRERIIKHLNYGFTDKKSYLSFLLPELKQKLQNLIIENNKKLLTIDKALMDDPQKIDSKQADHRYFILFPGESNISRADDAAFQSNFVDKNYLDFDAYSTDNDEYDSNQDVFMDNDIQEESTV